MEGDEVVGYALLSQRKFQEGGRLSGVMVTSIIDILWDFRRQDVLRSMLRWIERFARDKKSDVLIASVNNKKAQRNLILKGYIKIPSTVYFAYHSANPEISLSVCMDDWFVTRGDADAAGSLGPEK